MKTILTPPPITQGIWQTTQHDGQHCYVGTRDERRKDTIAKVFEPVDAHFIAAAPAMAEALLNLMEMAEGIDTLHMSRAAEWGVKHRLEKALTALISAGYTEAADQE